MGFIEDVIAEAQNPIENKHRPQGLQSCLDAIAFASEEATRTWRAYQEMEQTQTQNVNLQDGMEVESVAAGNLLDPPECAQQPEIEEAVLASSLIESTPPIVGNVRHTETPRLVNEADQHPESLQVIMPGTTRQSQRRATKTNGHVDPADTEYRPATLIEKQQWRGFCEIESEPAVLNALIRELGVTDLSLEEVYAIDEAVIKQLGPRIHGFLFLYQVSGDEFYEDVMEEGLEVQDPDAYKSLWFANQTASNACATVALVNLLANSRRASQPIITNGNGTNYTTKELTIIEKLLQDDIVGTTTAATTISQDLANPLSSPDPDSHLDLTAFHRGERIRSICGPIHNPFARKMDMLNSDLVIDNDHSEYEKEQKPNKKKRVAKSKRKPTPASKRKKSNNNRDDGNVHHYVAYLWKDGAIWMVDGMKYRPERLRSWGPSSSSGPTSQHPQQKEKEEEHPEDWWKAVLPTIQQRMMEFEFGGIGANLLALVDRHHGTSVLDHDEGGGGGNAAEDKKVDHGPLLHAWIEMVVGTQVWKDGVIARGVF